MSIEKRTITNESGKTLTMMIDPANTIQHIYGEVEWTVSESQWKRLVKESDNTAWSDERGAFIRFTCLPYAGGCRYPGRG